MVYPRIQNSGLPPHRVAALSAAFEEICRLLGLSPTEDALRDIVADIVIECADRGVVDPQEIMKCAREALANAG